jgi:hypothetical protein
MIRIDEIYNNTFWPWFKKHLHGYRMFMCDPFGSSDPESIKNYGHDDIYEHNYIFFFDQEPIHLNIHLPTFDQVVELNKDIHSDDFYDPVSNRVVAKILRDKDFNGPGFLVTSEKNSKSVDTICEKYKWKSYYYFFHGWASLDWYRGYNHTFLITPWKQRQILNTFIAPNRIIAGERLHRLEMLYHIFNNNLVDNHISCPAVCPVENISINDAAKSLTNKYPNAIDVFSSQNLPMNFKNETGHPMHSCWLSLFEESAESMLYLVTETVYTEERLHLTEKTFKPIALGMPFIIVGTRGSLQYLHSYGFKTFGDLWDESYDNCDDAIRIQKIAQLLIELDRKSTTEKQKLFESAHSIIEHNWNHFYNGGFEKILWKELTGMLDDIKSNS